VSEQRKINDALWAGASPEAQPHYLSSELRPPERVAFARQQAALRGRVLEIGVGAGRLTGHLVATASELWGIDIAPGMVAHCRSAFPQAHFAVDSLEGAGAAAGDGFDAIVAGYNVIDVVDEVEREAVLGGWRDLLVPGGTLILSTHNLAAEDTLPRPGRILARRRYEIAGNLRSWRLRRANHRRLAPLERRGDGWATINDPGEEHAVLHLYVTRAHQERQFRALGFEPVECVDLEGRLLADGEDAPGSVELHYVARRAA